ncbi:MAG: nuclear transport factor 2 family protein [Pseudomonadota bacterium]
MQLKSIWVSLALALSVTACSVNLNINDTQLLGDYVSEEEQILSVLTTQQAAWNTGDIDGFMEGYWVSPDLRFASGGSVTSGWQATLDRYKTNYSDRSLMGSLSFDELEVALLSDDAAVVHGAWALQRADDRPSGLFTLVFRKFSDEWKIVSDTTTSAGG